MSYIPSHVLARAENFGTRLHSRGLLARVGLVTAALVLGLAAPPVQAHDIVAAEMMPLDDSITLHREAVIEIDRQGNARVAQLGRWIEWWIKIKGLATETGDKLSKDFDER